MARYRKDRPLQDVRLRNWTSGRQAELKLMISRLEDVLNDTLAAQVDQSVAREVSDEVAFIIRMTVNAGYRQFKVDFPTPPGLKRLLFYEIQHDDNNAFNSPTTITTPQNNIIISGVGLNETRFFRARAVNTDFKASTWTSTYTATTAKGVIAVTRPADAFIRMVDDVGVWQDITSFTYDPAGGAITVQAQLTAGARRSDLTILVGGSPVAVNSGPAQVQFRWLLSGPGIVGDREIGDRAVLSARPFKALSMGPSIQMHGLMTGVLPSPFMRLGGSGTFTFKLQGMKVIGSEWAEADFFPPTLGAPKESHPIVFANDIHIIEVQEEF